jgi:class 3 adenylate cyclase
MSDAPAGAIVFTDIVGFTELTELHGDDAALELVDRLDAAVRASLPPQARIVKALGDGMLLWFDRADDAIACSLGLQAELDRSSSGDAALPLWVRTGVHWGSPRSRGDDIIGRDVNLTARVADLAAPGEVLCTDAVAQQAVGLATVTFAALGAVYVKGIALPVPVLRVQPRQGD